MLPAQRSVQNFNESVPLPSGWPFQLPRSIGTGGQVDRRKIHADRAHQQARRGLVASAHEHRAIDRQAAQRFFGVHRQQVAIEHGAGLHVHLGDGERRDLDRKSARLPDAALDRFRALAQVQMARVDFAPGIDDGDDGPAGEILPPVAELLQARAVAEAAQLSGPNQRKLRRSSGAFRHLPRRHHDSRIRVISSKI